MSRHHRKLLAPPARVDRAPVCAECVLLPLDAQPAERLGVASVMGAA